MQESITIGVTALIHSPDRKLLLGIKGRSKHAEYIGKWVTPGGKINYGESKQHAMRREMLEETGIHAADKCFEVGTDELIIRDAHYVFIVFQVFTDQAGKAGDDLSELAWMDLSQLRFNLGAMTPFTQRIVERFCL